jgi:hypothetical protein
MIFNFFFVEMILNFQKEINLIMYIIEFKKKKKLESFHLNKISIKYEFSKFIFLWHLKWSILWIECNVTYYHNKWGGLMVKVFACIPMVNESNLMGGIMCGQ